MKILVLIVLSLFILALSPVYAAGPCKCEDVQKAQDQLTRVTKSEEAWKQIFAWAKGLRQSGKPQSNEEMNGKFSELMNTPAEKWDDVINQQTAPKSVTKIAGLDDSGEPIIDAGFAAANCEEIVEAERVHERAHKEFFLRVGNVIQAYSEEHLLQIRAESEVVSYQAQKEYLKTALNELEKKCRILLRIKHRIYTDPKSPGALLGDAQFDGTVEFDITLKYVRENFFGGSMTVNRSLVVRHVVNKCSGSGRQTESWAARATLDPATDLMDVELEWGSLNGTATWKCIYVGIQPLVNTVTGGLDWSLKRMSTKAGTETSDFGRDDNMIESIKVQVMQWQQ